MTPEQRDELKAAAQAASPGPWKGDRYDGTVKYELLDANDNAVIKGDNGNSGDGGYGITNYEDEVYLKAANPSAILSLIAQVEALTEPQWISVEDRLPEDRQDVTFVVRASGPFEYLNGRVLAGTFIASYCGDFSVPGLTVGASYWMLSPAAPTIPATPGTKEDAT